MKYQVVYMFSKYTDMLPYFNANHERICGVPTCNNTEAYQKRVDNARAYYAKSKPVSLFLLVRYEAPNHTICRIKCPVNPLPVKGEFVASSLSDVISSLRAHGWEQITVQNRFDLSMFE